jgi:hypothetical protein
MKLLIVAIAALAVGYAGQRLGAYVTKPVGPAPVIVCTFPATPYATASINSRATKYRPTTGRRESVCK